MIPPPTLMPVKYLTRSSWIYAGSIEPMESQILIILVASQGSRRILPYIVISLGLLTLTPIKYVLFLVLSIDADKTALTCL